MSLSRLLSIPRGLTAIIGSGGKTTAMYTLARELSALGTVICATSTHIYPPAHLPVLVEPTPGEILRALSAAPCLCVGAPGPSGKLSAPALSMEELCALADYVLVEADGSRSLPLKAHLPSEPVIPACAAVVLHMVGLSGLGKPLAAVSHRPEVFSALSGLGPDEPVTPAALAAVLRREALTRTVFLNQADDADGLALAGEVAALLPQFTVYAGSLERRSWQCLS